MIIPVKKYIFIGVSEDLNLFFKRAQTKGFIEFIKDPGKASKELPEILQRLLKALKILRQGPMQTQKENVKDLDPDKLINSIIESQNWLEKLEEDARFLAAEIARVRPLGTFSLEEMREIEREGKRHFQFFCVKRSKAKKMTVPKELIYLSTDYDLDYYLSISPHVETYPEMIEMHVEHSLETLENRLAFTHESIQNCHKELKENAAYIDFLKEHLTRELNRFNLSSAKNEITSHMNETLFSAEAWVPENHLHSLFPLLEGFGIHAEEIAVEEDDRVPTYMENTGFAKIGEDLVHIYDTPAASDKDPSKWVFWSFAVFYAMIISDAGYGLIYLLLALFLGKKFKQAGQSVKRLLRLFTVLSLSMIVWGVLAGSYFVLYLKPKNPINTISCIHVLAVKRADYILKAKDESYHEIMTAHPGLSGVTSGSELLEKGFKIEPGSGRTKFVVYDEFRDSIFMELALIVGVIHISLSLLKHARRHYAGIGWVMATVGGYLYFPKILNATSMIHYLGLISKPVAFEVGLQLLYAGMGLAIVLALIQNRLKGLVELTKPIELFADILSYLRLYALGLAGMILAETFNGMAESWGPVLGAFVLLIGHTTNIAVGMIGGTIHGLRLNFIEWYHHCFEGGGKLFHPLKLLKIKGD